MNSISMNSSCIVLLIIVVSSIANDIKWSDTAEVAKRVKKIDQKLASFKQVVISSREACEQFMNNNCEKISWGSELSVYKEDGCYKIEQSIHLYCIIFLGIVLIVLVFYFHTAHPELYLSEYEENQSWQNVGCSGDTNSV